MFRRIFKSTLVLSLAFSVLANAKAPHKEWGMLVFLNGHNNLDSFGDGDISEMLKAKDTSNIHVVVLHASLRHKKTRYRYIENGKATTLKEVSPVDMGSYKNLVEFAKWAMAEYPADKYFIDIWNHGAGWQKNSEDQAQFRNISNDDVFGTEISTEQLGVAMSEISTHLGRKVDVVGMDACLMAMAEVAGEIQGSAKAMIASQDLEPGDGWPYDEFLNGFATLQDRSIDAVASLLTKVFVSSYTNGTQGSNSKVTLSAVNLENFPRFESALRSMSNDLLASALSDPGFIKRFIEAQKYVQKFYQSDYVDFFDVVSNLKSKNLLSSKSVADDVEAAFKDIMIANSYGSYFTKAKGLSVWLPYMNYSIHGTRYRGLAFSKNTQWGDWLEKAYRSNNQ